MSNPSQELERVRAILTSARTIAVLGAHPNPNKPAHYVPAYLATQGYRVLPINPMQEGQTLFGNIVRARLDAIGEPIDVVDVFRRSDALPAHVEDILAMKPLPKVVWFQLGIRNDEVAKALEARGIEVIQDRCMLADHRALGLTAR